MKQLSFIYLIFAILCGISAALNNCFYQVLAGAEISGEVSGYENDKYSSFLEAKKVCDDNVNCKGISKRFPTAPSSEQNIELNAIPYFTLRGTTEITYHDPQVLAREISYLKQTCIPKDYVVSYGKFLSQCADECKDYETLESALEACRSLESCGGVTLSEKYIGGNKSTNPIQGKFGYQLRAKSKRYISRSHEDSWVKVESSH